MSVARRWRVRGRLYARTTIRVGSGEVTTRATLPETEEVLAVAATSEGRPYLPGSSLKGAVRAWLGRRAVRAVQMEVLFGQGPGPGHRGGQTLFADALLLADSRPFQVPAHWQSKSRTGVVPGVAIDRVTRAAQARMLGHYEIVPPCSAFAVDITATDLGDEAVALLLAGLMGFNNASQPITLGSRRSSDYGHLHWELEAVERIDPVRLRSWLSAPQPGSWTSLLQPLPEPELGRLLARGSTLALAPREPGAWSDRLPWRRGRKPAETAGGSLRVTLRISFDSPFLVNDPPPAGEDKGPQNPDHRPRRNAAGEPVLPASSLRGALRAQAERIVRTLGGHACPSSDPEERCAGIENVNDLAQLCPVCQLFGAPGWRASVRFSEFRRQPGTGHPLIQHFVAIDRFTSGAAPKRKFLVHAIHGAVLVGSVQLDLARLRPLLLGLLALVVRDLCEGDIAFGYGAAKGYGQSRVTLTAAELSALHGSTAWTDAMRTLRLDTTSGHVINLDDPALHALLQTYVEEFRASIRESRDEP